MNIVKYDPFRELRSLQDDMTRLFTGIAPSSYSGDAVSGAWNPRVDIFEDKENLILEADLPGMSREDFDISVENNVLTLQGERKFEKKTEGDNYHRVERSYGSFLRSFTLPQSVTPDGASADFENGILRVTLPKREETRAKKIEIKGSRADSKAIDAGKTTTAKA